MWRNSNEEWERRKSYLIRSLFEDLPLLSPIYESQEPTPPSPFNDIYKPESPLPDLIIEIELPKYQQDEPEEFYKQLAREMRKMYRRDFLNIDISNSTDTTYEVGHEKYTEKDLFKKYTKSLDLESSVDDESIAEEEYCPEISINDEEEEEEERRSPTTSTNSTDELICRYEQITTTADVHAAVRSISEPSFDEEIHRREGEETQSTSTTANEYASSDKLEISRRIPEQIAVECDAEISLEEADELAKYAEASQERSIFKSPEDYKQQTPEIMRRRQTVFSENSLSNEINSSDSYENIINESCAKEMTLASSVNITASGFEMEISDTSVSDFNVTSTPKSRKHRSRIAQRYKERLVPYSPSSSPSTNMEPNAAFETSCSYDELDWKDYWSNFFVGKPTVYNICFCKNHVCS